MKIRTDYDKEYDILSINFGGDVESSREFTDVNIVFDFNKKGEVVGFEMFDFRGHLKKSDEEIENIFKESEKKK